MKLLIVFFKAVTSLPGSGFQGSPFTHLKTTVGEKLGNDVPTVFPMGDAAKV